MERHRDRGDGTCGYCYEEWPCRGTAGEASGVHRWSGEEAIAHALEESKRRMERNRLLTKRLARLGVELELPDFASGVMLSIDAIEEMVHRVELAERRRRRLRREPA